MMTTTPSTYKRLLGGLAPVLAAGLLLGMAAVNFSFPTAEDAEDYHQRVLTLTEAAPTAFGNWTSRPVEIPPSAVELLRPNAILSRTFTDRAGRREASFLIVQCRDARDLSGHWPPNCYKANGYTAVSADPVTWTVDGAEFPGIEYVFEIDTAGKSSRIVVSNFMILPGVGYVRDMHDVREAGADHRRRFFGAAQLQVVTVAAYSDAQRRAIVGELITPHLPLIRSIRHLPTASEPEDPAADPATPDSSSAAANTS